jgi:hypothetical protein
MSLGSGINAAYFKVDAVCLTSIRLYPYSPVDKKNNLTTKITLF